MIFFFPQWSVRGCGTSRATLCRTSSHQRDTFVRALCSDTPFSLALLEQTWLWLRALLLGVIYSSGKSFINPVILRFGRASREASSHGCDNHSLMLGLETSGEPPQIAIWHLWKKPQPWVEGRKETCTWSSVWLGQVISHPVIMRSTLST